ASPTGTASPAPPWSARHERAALRLRLSADPPGAAGAAAHLAASPGHAAEAEGRELPADPAPSRDRAEGGDAGADALVADPSPLPDRGGADRGAGGPRLPAEPGA